MLELEPGAWVWCLRCARCYQKGECRRIGDMDYCPYEDCTASVPLDGWPWEQIREMNPAYPEPPARGEVYPVYRPK